jgi:Ca-activated chloride channel homolog
VLSLEFVRLELLLLLGLLPLWWLAARPARRAGVLFSRSGQAASASEGRWRSRWLARLPRLLRAAALATLIVVLAGPVLIFTKDEVEREEIAIVMAVDLSSSMLAEDMEQGKTRMQVARETAVRFVLGRPDDRIGLVAFAGEALTRVPPTNDRDVVVAAVESLDIGLLQDGTDISGAIIAATNRLLTQPHETKIIVLLTDGAHNAHGVTPLAAAEVADAHGIRVFAISILGDPIGAEGTESTSEIAVAQRTQLAQEIETVLTQVARVSGGRYFHASNRAALDSVYVEVGRLATTSMTLVEQTESVPVHSWFLLVSVFLICSEAAIRGTRHGVVP